MWLKQCHKPPICYGLYHPFMVFFWMVYSIALTTLGDFDLTSHSPSAASEGEDDGLYMVYIWFIYGLSTGRRTPGHEACGVLLVKATDTVGLSRAAGWLAILWCQ